MRSNLPKYDTAIYLPAVNRGYAEAALRATFGLDPDVPETLNFLRSAQLPSERFTYPFALYSFGQGGGSAKNMLNARDPNTTFTISDSGGYQIEQGTMAFKGTRSLKLILKWMARHGDLMMPLYFPTGGISRGYMRDHTARLIREGFDLREMSARNGQGLDFNACLKQTEINLEGMLELGAPVDRMFNVLQGRNESESRVWYQAMKRFPNQNWAIAGNHPKALSMLLSRLLDMRGDGRLGPLRWLHILGESKLELACLYTTIQAEIRKIADPAFQVSFDSASPFRLAASFGICAGHLVGKQGWSIQITKAAAVPVEMKSLTLNEFSRAKQVSRRKDGLWLPAASDIGRRVTMQALPTPGSQQGISAEGTLAITNHNVEAFVKAHTRAQDAHEEGGLGYMPIRLHTARIAIEKVFASRDPWSAIRDRRHILDVYAG